MCFPGDSVGKESACNGGDPSSIPVSGRSPKEDPLKKAVAAHSSILAGESHGQSSLVGCSPWGHKESRLDRVSNTAAHCCVGCPRSSYCILLNRVLEEGL